MLQAKPGVQYPHCDPPASARPACTGCRSLGRAESLRGHELLAVECRDRHEAGVHRRPLGAAAVAGRREQHRARAALALGAPLLAAGEADAAQPLERRGVRRDALQRAPSTVDRHAHVIHANSSFRSLRRGVHADPVTPRGHLRQDEDSVWSMDPGRERQPHEHRNRPRQRGPGRRGDPHRRGARLRRGIASSLRSAASGAARRTA